MNKFPLDISNGIILCKSKIMNGELGTVCKMAVDTGASYTMIAVETALSVGIDPSRARRHVEITTANGVIFVPVVKVPRFICFGMEIKGLDIVCHNLPSESCVEGLLGLNFLKNFRIFFDFPGKSIEI